MPDGTLIESMRRFYDVVARRSPEQPFLNFGFDEVDAPGRGAPAADLVAACRRLYEAVLLPFPVESGRVVEIGCGRGGGAGFLTERCPNLRYLGLDLSLEHLALCRKRFAARKEMQFALADAARLPVPDCRFDVAYSVEAVQHFEQPDRFYREVARLLRPGGWFLLTTLWRPGQEPAGVFERSGLLVRERCDITANVLASLDRTSTLRQDFVDSLNLPERFKPIVSSWAGVRGTESVRGSLLGSAGVRTVSSGAPVSAVTTPLFRPGPIEPHLPSRESGAGWTDNAPALTRSLMTEVIFSPAAGSTEPMTSSKRRAVPSRRQRTACSIAGRSPS